MSCFLCDCAASSVLEPSLSHLRALFRVGAWCSDPGTHVLSFGFVSRFGHSRSMFSFIFRHSCLEFTCVVFHVVARSSCFMLLHAVRVLSAACIHVMYCAVWHAACVFHGQHAVMLSCLVWIRGLWVFSLAAISSCPILHMACDFVLLAMCFFLCVSTWLLSEFSHVNCLDLALSCLALPCLALPCPALPCPALPCPALPCPVLFFLYRVVFVALFILFCANKAHHFAQLSPCLIPSPQPWHT